MRCSNCGTENYNTNYCTECGAKLGDVNMANNNQNFASSNIPTSQPNFSNSFNGNFTPQTNYTSGFSSTNFNDNGNNNQKEKKNHTALIIIIIILIIALLVGLYLFFKKSDDDKVNNNSTNPTINESNNNTSSTNNNQNNNNNNNNSNSNSNSNSNNNSNNQPSSTENNNIIVKFNNYKLEAKMIMTISGIEVDTTFTGEIDELNQKAHLVIDMNSMGFVLTTESYTDYKTGYSYIKNPYATEWVKQNGGTQFVDLNNVASQLKNMKNVTKIDDNHYKVIIAKEDIIGMLETTEADTDEITGDIAADVYLKDGYISEIYYDFSQMMDEFDEFTFDMKIYDYDKAGNVEIPQDIIESATEY